MTCGLLRRSHGRFLGNSRFYEEQYESYYSRPGAAHYDASRYAAMAEWMKSALGDFAPRSILDIGCGAGWSMMATAALYSGASIEGVEPSLANADKARNAGFVVSSTRLGSEQTPPKEYDLIYANNVLQHVVDPVAFLSEIPRYLSPVAQIVFILPDAEEPCCEMLWCDHNFSFRATDLAALAEKTGFELSLWEPNPANDTLLNKQLVVLNRKGRGNGAAATLQNLYSIEELFDRRSQYINRWRSLNEELARSVSGYDRVFNFGGSMWTWHLAGNCPDYWSQVTACIVDGERGQCVGKRVLPTIEISFNNTDCIVLGINPVNQAKFADRLSGAGVRIITWSDLISI